MSFIKFFNRTALRKLRLPVRSDDRIEGTQYLVEGDGQIELVHDSAPHIAESIKIHFKTSPYRSLTLWRSPFSAVRELKESSRGWWTRVYKVASRVGIHSPGRADAPSIVFPVVRVIPVEKVHVQWSLPARSIALSIAPVVLPENRSIKLNISPIPSPRQASAVTAPALDLRRPNNLYSSTDFQI